MSPPDPRTFEERMSSMFRRNWQQDESGSSTSGVPPRLPPRLPTEHDSGSSSNTRISSPSSTLASASSSSRQTSTSTSPRSPLYRQTPSRPPGIPSPVTWSSQQEPSRPPGIPLPTPHFSKGILTTIDKGPGEKRFYTIICVSKAKPSGLYYLLSDNENGGLWHGHYEGPMAYFTAKDRPRRNFPLYGFKLGNKPMMPICANLLFPPYNAAKMKRYHGPIDAVHVKWQDIFGPANSEKIDYTCRNRLANEVAICERISIVPHPNLARYQGVVVENMAGGARVTSIAFKKYNTTLWEFASHRKLLSAENVGPIVQAVYCGVKALHRREIVHRQVMAGNVYIDYTMMTTTHLSVGGDGSGTVVEYVDEAHIEEVVLGNFDQAKHCSSDGEELAFYRGKQHDEMRVEFLEEWLRSAVPNTDRTFTEEDKAIMTHIQAGNLNREQSEELDRWLEDRLNKAETHGNALEEL